MSEQFGGIDIVALINEYVGTYDAEPERERDRQLSLALKVLLTPEQMHRAFVERHAIEDRRWAHRTYDVQTLQAPAATSEAHDAE